MAARTTVAEEEEDDAAASASHATKTSIHSEATGRPESPAPGPDRVNFITRLAGSA